MNMRRYLQRLRDSVSRGRRTKRPGKLPWRPQVESLEDRTVPTIVFKPHFKIDPTTGTTEALNPSPSGNFNDYSMPNSPNVYLIFYGQNWTTQAENTIISGVQAILNGPFLSGLSEYSAYGSGGGPASYGNFWTDSIAPPAGFDPTKSANAATVQGEIQRAIDQSGGAIADPGIFTSSRRDAPIYVVVTDPQDSPNGAGWNGSGTYTYHLPDPIDINIDVPINVISMGTVSSNMGGVFDGTFSHEFAETVAAAGGVWVSQFPSSPALGDLSQQSGISDGEPDNGRYGYSLGGPSGVPVQPYFSFSNQAFIVPDGNAQNFVLYPRWDNNTPPNFLRSYDLTIDGDPSGNTITLDTDSGYQKITVNGQSAWFLPGTLHWITINSNEGSGTTSTINVEHTFTGVATYINLGSGTDTVNISPTAQNLNNIPWVDVHGGSGSDTLNIYDQNAASGPSYEYDVGSISVQRSIPFQSGGSTVVYHNMASVVVNTANSGASHLVVGKESVPPPPVTLDANGNGNTVDVWASNSPLTVSCTGSGNTIDVGAGYHDLTLIGGSVTINGGQGGNTLIIEDQNGPTGSNYPITSGQVAVVRPGGHYPGPAGLVPDAPPTPPTPPTLVIDYSGTTLSSLDLYGSSGGGNTYAVNGTGAGYTTTLHTAATDQVRLGTGASLQGQLVLARAGASPVPFTVDDSQDSGSPTITLNSVMIGGTLYGQVSGLGAPLLYKYSDTSGVTVQTGTGGATVNVQATLVPVNLVGHGSNTTVNVGNNGSVQNILGAVTVSNPPSYTTLNVNASADTTGGTVTISDSGITGLANGIYYQQSDLRALNVSGSSYKIFVVNNTPSNGAGVTTTINCGNHDEVDVAGTTGPLVINNNNYFVRVGTSGPSAPPGRLAPIQGPVTVHNTPQGTGLFIDDRADAANRNVSISDRAVSFAGSAAINFDPTLVSPLILGGSGNDSYTVTNTASGVYTVLEPGAGANTINVQGTSGTLQIQGQGGHDTVTVGSLAPSLGGTLANIHGGVFLYGDISHTALVVDNKGDTTNHSGVTLSASVLNGLAPVPIDFVGPSHLSSVTVWEGSGTDAVAITGTASGTPTTLHAETGNDAITVAAFSSPNGNTVKNVVSPLTIYGRPDLTTLTLDDYGGGSADHVTITSTQVGAASSDNFFGSSGSSRGSLTYSGLKAMTVNTANVSTGDTINVVPNTTTAFVINGGPLVNGTLIVQLPSGVTAQKTVTGPGSGYFTFTPSTYQRVTYSGMANLRTALPGLVSWYLMEGSTADVVGSHNPSATNAVTFVPGQVGQGAKFDGATSYIDIPDSPSLDNTQFTLDAWVRPDGPGPNTDGWGSAIIQKLLARPAGDWIGSVLLNWRASDNRFILGRGDIRSSSNVVFSTHTFAPGHFYHVAATYDGTTAKLYVNGVLEGQCTPTTPLTYDSSPWTIGSSNANFRSIGYARTWNGVIDEAQIYNRALSASEIQAIYNAGQSQPAPTPGAVPTVAPAQVQSSGSAAPINAGTGDLTPSTSAAFFVNGRPLVNSTAPAFGPAAVDAVLGSADGPAPPPESLVADGAVLPGFPVVDEAVPSVSGPLPADLVRQVMAGTNSGGDVLTDDSVWSLPWESLALSKLG
jgi:hypothetical protein